MDLNQKIFKKIADLGNYSSFEPQEVSIGWIPFPVRTRNLFSHLDIVNLIIEGLVKKIKGISIEGLIGAETAGIPLAMALSQQTKIPFGYVRKQVRKWADNHCTEGDFKNGQIVGLVDDTMSSAKTKKALINNLKLEGLEVKSIFVIWVDVSKECQEAIAEFEKQGIRVLYLFNWVELLDGLYKYGFIPEKLYPLYKDFLTNRDGWMGSDKIKWYEYVKVLNELNIQVPKKFQDWLEK